MSFLEIKDPVFKEFTVNYFKIAREQVKKHVDEQYLRVKYGEINPKAIRELTHADLANNIFYLYGLLTSAYYEFASSDKTVDEEEYKTFYENYSIECIKQNFLCWGYDISPLLELFSLVCREDFDGIGYMYIFGGTTLEDQNEFIIT